MITNNCLCHFCVFNCLQIIENLFVHKNLNVPENVRTINKITNNSNFEKYIFGN